MRKRLDADTHKKRYSTFVLIPLTLLLIAAGKSPAKIEKYCGHYVFGHEVRTFQPCSADKVYWVKADEAISQRLRKAHSELSKKPYAPIYVEIQGRILDKATDGFAADYDEQLFIERITLIRERRKDDCK